jgi:hypothetical protein
MLVGAAHLLFAGRDGTPPEAAEVRKMIAAAISRPA